MDGARCRVDGPGNATHDPHTRRRPAVHRRDGWMTRTASRRRAQTRRAWPPACGAVMMRLSPSVGPRVNENAVAIEDDELHRRQAGRWRGQAFISPFGPVLRGERGLDGDTARRASSAGSGGHQWGDVGVARVVHGHDDQSGRDQRVTWPPVTAATACWTASRPISAGFWAISEATRPCCSCSIWAVRRRTRRWSPCRGRLR